MIWNNTEEIASRNLIYLGEITDPRDGYTDFEFMDARYPDIMWQVTLSETEQPTSCLIVDDFTWYCKNDTTNFLIELADYRKGKAN